MLEVIVKDEKPKDEKSQEVNRVLDLIAEQKEWQSKGYTRIEATYEHAPRQEPRYIFVPEVNQSKTYKLGNEPMTAKNREPSEDYAKTASRETPREERKGAMSNMDAAEMVEDIKLGRFFGTLNDLSVEKKEQFNEWKKYGVGRVLRRLYEGPSKSPKADLN